LSEALQLAKQQAKRSIPNDPLFSGQWHLRNVGQGGGTAGVDVNITNVWDTYRGAGIAIAIVDDGLQVTHPDLAPAVNTAIDWDFNDNDSDPSPDVFWNYHGTECAGVAAARGNNALGVSGAAPEATLVGLRLIGGPSDDTMEAAALNHSKDVIFISNNSWGPDDYGTTLEGPGPLASSALIQGVTSGRGGKGTIFTWAGGNGLEYKDNANYDGYANSIYTIAIGAVNDRGAQATYSEPGACLVVTAPSSSNFRQGITTTDLAGFYGDSVTDYFSDFGGTSSATPLAAGVIALMLQANPELGWRDVQEILIRTAVKVSPADSDWANNGAGLHFNHKFGAGLINAEAAVALAQNWRPVCSQASVSSNQTALALAIPDNNSTGISRSFAFGPSPFGIEHVTVTVNITHANRGDLSITLTSPSGKQSRLAERHDDTGNNYSDWKLMSVHHWGESLDGVWTVNVADRRSGYAGVLNSVQVTLYGTRPTLEVTPDLDFVSTGLIGGPFGPVARVYTLSNPSRARLDWQAGVGAPWLTLSAAAGSLAGGETTNVTVSLNSVACRLIPGEYATALGFTNATSLLGGATHLVSLSVTSNITSDFEAGPTRGALPLRVGFTNLSAHATSYRWEFGDGHTSTNEHPVNEYTAEGVYSVRLTAFASGWSNTLARTDFIVVTSIVVASFEAQPTQGRTPLTVSLQQSQHRGRALPLGLWQWRHEHQRASRHRVRGSGCVQRGAHGVQFNVE
jgi:subtilisin-like proprotein convertase family protein